MKMNNYRAKEGPPTIVKPVKAQGEKRFSAVLSKMSDIFCEARVGVSGKMLCAAVVSPEFDGVTFSVTNLESFFMKDVLEQEFSDIRELLDLNKTITWQTFFQSLKLAFYQSRALLVFPPDGSSCDLKIELFFPSWGKTTLTFSLTRAQPPLPKILTYFCEPLFSSYSYNIERNASKILQQLEQQIQIQRNIVQGYEIRSKEMKDQEENEGDNNVKEKHNKHNNASNPQKSYGNDKLAVPTKYLHDSESQPSSSVTTTGDQLSKQKAADDTDVWKFDKVSKELQAIRKRLMETKGMTESEVSNFDKVIEIVEQNDLKTIQEKEKNDDKNVVDSQVISFLRDKFSNRKRVKKDDNIFRSAHDFLMASNINLTQTREQIVAMFERVDDYNFDVFTLEKLTGGQTLFITGYTLFVKYDLLSKFNIPETTLINFLKEIEAGYHPNPYHNAMHAADVTQVLHYMIGKGGLVQFMADEDIFASLLSAICHDYDHPGLNNNFQINANTYLATLYNDRSVLENHHCAQTFELMKAKKFNILEGLKPEQRRDVRETACQMILSTDMSIHARVVGKFKAKVENEIDPNSKEDLRLILQIAIKMADVSNPSRPLKLYLQWTDRICQEFYAQGDKERELVLPVSPLMDRMNQNIGKGQIAFIRYVVSPMFRLFSILFPQMNFTADLIENNRVFWERYPTENQKEFATRLEQIEKGEQL